MGPYSHTDENIKVERAKIIANACILLMEKGEISISPLTFGLSLIEKTGKNLPDDYAFWCKFCEEFVKISDVMYILDIEGWCESSGVRGEIEEAKKNNISVYLVESISLNIIKIL